MALPHPSMNFVPLDTLTASELNQIVANILALSKGTGLDNSSVKPEHFSSDVINLDWHDVSFQSGFRNYGGSYHPCQYAKDMFGNVYLVGLAANSSTNAFDRPIFNLPEGYRPAQTVIFATPNASSIGRIDIAPNGDVKLSSAHGASSGFVSLSGIVFKAV